MKLVFDHFIILIRARDKSKFIKELGALCEKYAIKDRKGNTLWDLRWDEEL